MTDQNKDNFNNSEKNINNILDEQDNLLTALVVEINALARGKVVPEILTGKTVTVTIGGTILSGHLISGVEYGRIFVATMEDSYINSGFNKENYVDVVMRVYKDIFQVYKEEPKKLPMYFHMKDAVLILPNGRNVVFPIWRGKIKDVNAFAIGKMEIT